MSDVFVSYKREDEVRVARLVQALERSGFSVWWDRDLAAGDGWQSRIESALSAAKCVIVVWTQGSVAPAAEFVRDEARRAKRRGVLVPVLLDRVDLPLGFGERQAIDLTRWRGSRRDPFFKDLCAAVQAKLETREVPPPEGPRKRLMRRIGYGTVASATAAGLMVGFNLFAAQDQVCGFPVFQPLVADLCGALGIGGRATKAERVAWEAREPGSCGALRAHIDAFPNGAYQRVALDLIAAREVTPVASWRPAERRLALFVGQSTSPLASEAEARSDALDRAQSQADRLCDGFAASTSFRLRSARPEPQAWDCSAVLGGAACGFEGQAICHVDERHVYESETCGS